VNMVMNLRVPKNSGKFLNSCATSDLSRRAQVHGVSWMDGRSVGFLVSKKFWEVFE
jgi:hypothetical protein